MSLKNRVKRLEIKQGVNQGLTYFVHENNNSYTLKKNGVDVTEDVEMTQKEYEDWCDLRLENDCVFVISRGAYSTKENENV